MKKHFLAIVFAIFIASTMLEAQENATISLDVVERRERYAEFVTENKAAATTIITAEDIKTSGATSLVELLREHGIVAIEEISTGSQKDSQTIYLQGIDASRILIVIDGQRVRSGDTSLNATLMQSYTSALKRTPLSSIESIEIVKGGGSYLWGSDAMGGVIYIRTKRGSKDKGLHGSLGMAYKNNFEFAKNNNLILPYINLSYGWQSGFAWAGTSFEYGDKWQSAYKLDNSNTEIPNERDKYINFDIYAGSQFDIGDNQNIEITARYQQEKSPLGYEPQNFYRSVMGNFKYSLYLLDNLDLSFCTGLTYDYNLEQETIDGVYNINDIDENTYIFNDSYIMATYYLNDRFTLKGGCALNLEILEEATNNLSYIYNQQSYALFFGGDINIDKNIIDIDITAGVRYEIVTRGGSTPLYCLSPELGIIYKPIKYLVFKAHAGRSFSAPDLLLAFGNYYDHYTFWVLSNAELLPETLWSYNARVELYPLKNISFSLGVFRNDIQNLIAYKSIAGETYNDLPVYQAINIDKAYTYGVDIAANGLLKLKNILVFNYNFNFEYLWAYNALEGDNRYIELDTCYYFLPRLENRPEYTLSGSLSCYIVESGTTLKFSGYYFGRGYEYISYGKGVYEEKRTEAMSSLDTRITQELPSFEIYSKKVETIIFFEVKNLLNAIYDVDGDGDTDRAEREFLIGFDLHF